MPSRHVPCRGLGVSTFGTVPSSSLALFECVRTVGGSMTNRTGRGRTRRSGVAAVVILLVVVGIPTAIGLFGGLAKTSGGEVAVVRNGGWFDNNQVRQVIQPAS